MTVPDTQGQQGTGEQENNGGHPAWSEILSVVPQELHDQLTPKLQAWDQGVQQKISQLHSEYEPYKEIISDYGPDDIKSAVGLALALQNDPQTFFQQLIDNAESLGIDMSEYLGQGAGTDPDFQQGQQGDNEDIYGERFSRMEEAIGTLAEALLQQQQGWSERDEDAALDQALNGLHQQFGDFDEDYVLTKIAAGVEPNEAVESFFKLTGKNPKSENVPPVLGAGGSLPTNRQDLTKMSPSDTEKLVASMLQAANQQGG